MMFPLALLCLCLAALCALVLVARKDLPRYWFEDAPETVDDVLHKHGFTSLLTWPEKLDHRLDTLNRQPIDWEGLDAEVARRQQLDAALKAPLAIVRRHGLVVHIRGGQR